MLAALGLVAWREREPRAESGKGSASALAREPVAAPMAETTTEPTAKRSTREPRPPLAAPAQAPPTVVGIDARSRARLEDGAPLVLIVDAAEAETPPLDPADERLLDAMLRAIDLRRVDLPMIAAEASAIAELPTGSPLRAALLLERPGAPAGRLDGLDDAIVRFRCPHPALLRSEPSLKREAWQTLKQLRRRLVEP